MRLAPVLLALVPLAALLAGEPAPSVERVARESLPDFAKDDLDRASLRKAIDENRRVLAGQPERRLSLGGVPVTNGELLATLDSFEKLLDLEPEALAAAVSSELVCWRSLGSDGKGTVLFTGYHSPRFQGSRRKSERFDQALYRVPADPSAFTRHEIESEGKLDGQGLEIVFCSRMDAFLMAVQGSGSVALEDGSLVRVQFTKANGRPYVSLGKELVKDGKIPREAISIPAIRAYFAKHPEEEKGYLERNPSYVFFAETKDPPRGCAGTAVTRLRSVATDKSVFPAGGLAFLVVEVPVVEAGRVVSWAKRARFVLDDDTGGAIKGPGRCDIYMGDDADAEAAAGVMNREGALYYLVKRMPP
jgi:membrane-bound lytic murein transglycosylase A